MNGLKKNLFFTSLLLSFLVLPSVSLVHADTHCTNCGPPPSTMAAYLVNTTIDGYKIVVRDLNGAQFISGTSVYLTNGTVVPCTDTGRTSGGDNPIYSVIPPQMGVSDPTGFSPLYDKEFLCLPLNLNGVIEKIEATDSSGMTADSTYPPVLSFSVAVEVSTDDNSNTINFPPVQAGQTAYSTNTLLVKNTGSTSVELYIAGQDMIDSSGFGICPTNNVLDIGNVGFRSKIGPFISEVFTPLSHYRESEPLYNGTNFIPDGPSADVLYPGWTAETTFQLRMPFPCLGTYQSPKIFIIAKSLDPLFPTQIIVVPLVSSTSTTTTTTTSSTTITTTTTLAPVDTDGDGVPDNVDACPNTYGTYCNGCPQPSCLGCAVASCPSQGVPFCVANNSKCSPTVCSSDGCGVGICNKNETGTYAPSANTCNLDNETGTCTNNACSLTCGYDKYCGAQERIDILQQQLDATNQKVSTLETTVNNLVQTVNSMQSTLQAFMNKVTNQLFYLPRGLKEQILCGSMSATNTTAATGFGLSCQINQKNACTCNLT